MKRYSEFRPSQFDSHIYVEGQEDWLVLPVMRNRDSKCLEKSNFAVALKMLGGEDYETVNVHRFGHWACGWFEIILVKPETEAANKAEEIETKLENYPVLDENDFSNREFEEAHNVWESCYTDKERIAYIRKHRSNFEFSSFSDMLLCVRGKSFCGCFSELLR